MKKHWFKFTLLALALVCGVVIWGLLDTLWDSMVAYEANSEIGAVTEYFNRFAAGDYETAVATTDFVFDERNSKEDYIRYLKEIFGTDFSDLRFAGSDGESSGEKIYRIYNGDTPLGAVRLVPVTGQARNWQVIAEVAYADPVTVIAPSYVTVLSNGNKATPTDGEPVSDEDFEALSEVFSVPTKVTYTLEGYLYTPTVTASAPDGTECVSATGEDGSITMTVPATEGQKAEFETLMTEFSQLYARYISKDATLTQLKPKMDTSTPFYDAVRGFYNAWYNDHTGYEFRNLEISDIVRPSEDCFAGTIRFDHVVFWGRKENVYPTAYRLSFRQVDGKWLLADLKIL